MPTIARIEDADDARVADYGGISDGELLRGRRHFVAEGRAVVERLVQRMPDAVASVLLSEAAFERLGPVLARLAADVPVFVTPLGVVKQVTGFNMHRGCLAIGRRPSGETAWHAVDAALTTGRPVVVLERLADADNVGSVFRSCRALGAAAVLLGPTCCDPLYRKAIRVSMGAVFDVPFARCTSWPRELDALRRVGYRVVALTPSAGAALDDMPRDPTARRALLVGAEGDGLSVEALERADDAVRIPMQPGVDSLNAAVATAIALHWWRKSGEGEER